jgi:putative ABC transport system substrate-binding protein
MILQRREFIAFLGGTAAWPLAARAQQRGLPVVAILSGGPAQLPLSYAAFLKALSETGFVENQNLVIETHFAENRYERLPALAAELVRRRVAVIVARGAVNTALAAKSATATIPIVFNIGSDPIEFGLVNSLSRPGGNVTEVTAFTRELLSKRLGILRELLPATTAIGVLVNENNPNAGPSVRQMEAIALAGGWKLQIVPINSDSDREPAFATLARLQVGGFLFTPNDSFNFRIQDFIELAARYRLPGIYTFSEFVRSGGLMSYGSVTEDINRQAGIYVGRILKGEKPADLPIVQPTKFEFVINLKTARALGITIPPTLLAIADEVIE